MYRFAFALWAVLIVVVCIKPLFKPFSGTVYITYAMAGEDFAEGSRLYNVNHPNTDNFRYLPVVAAGFAPLSQLPPGVGGSLWRVLGIAIFLTGIAAWARQLRPGIPMPLVMLFALPLAIGSLNNGQANTHVAGLMLWGCVLAGRGRWTAAALLVAGAALFKGYPIALGGLLLLLAPLRFGIPLAIGVGIGIVLPVAFQSADYVMEQYRYLLANLEADDRSSFPLWGGYQDAHMLFRIAGISISRDDFRFVQAGAGLLAAVVLWISWRRGITRADAAANAYSLGACWMCLFGPAVEASTFILLAPVLAYELLALETPRWAKLVAYLAATLFLATVVLFAFPHAVHRPVIALGILPIAAALLTIATTSRILTVRPIADSVKPSMEPERRLAA
ncbi:MAG TPA: glycosyltransferase family 87 protein [Gemmataceae bacterium]|jgi:hypothetical protein